MKGVIGRESIKQGFSNFSMYQNNMESLLKHRLLGPPLEFLIQLVWCRI